MTIVGEAASEGEISSLLLPILFLLYWFQPGFHGPRQTCQ